MNATIHDPILPKKAATVNDLTGFGRCSLAVVLPVINALGVQACPIPTSVFSSHMAFPSYYYKDLSDGLAPWLKEYEQMNLLFDGIYCGFINSSRQFPHLEQFMESQREKGCSVILIDPVLGDNGTRYRLVTEELCLRMKQFIAQATILTPNLTEACLLTDTPWQAEADQPDFLYELMEKLLCMGPSRAVITGIPHKGQILNYCGEKTAHGLSVFSCETSSNGESRPGTGDLFAAILLADAVNRKPFADSVRKATDFIRLCVNASATAHIPIREGVLFETYLPELWRQGNEQ